MVLRDTEEASKFVRVVASSVPAVWDTAYGSPASRLGASSTATRARLGVLVAIPLVASSLEVRDIMGGLPGKLGEPAAMPALASPRPWGEAGCAHRCVGGLRPGDETSLQSGTLECAEGVVCAGGVGAGERSRTT